MTQNRAKHKKVAKRVKWCKTGQESAKKSKRAQNRAIGCREGKRMQTEQQSADRDKGQKQGKRKKTGPKVKA